MLNNIAWSVSLSASVYGIPVMLVLMALLVSNLPRRSLRQRSSEIVLMLGVLSVVLALVSFLNENYIKPDFHIFRPNIQLLADHPVGQPALKMSAADFYAMPDKHARSEYLSVILNGVDYTGPMLQPLVKQHWIHETGFSFPSGHTTAATALASFFLALALGRFSGKGLLPYLMLPLWAILVAASRIVLQVHSPLDVLAGGIQGFVVGMLAWMLFNRVQRKGVEAIV